METKCDGNSCQEKPFDIMVCGDKSFAFCDLHRSKHLKKCSASHSITSLYQKLSKDKRSQFTSFIKNELNALTSQSVTIITRINDIFGKLNQITANALACIHLQKKKYNDLLKCIEKNKSLPISFFEEDVKCNPIEISNLEVSLKKNIIDHFKQLSFIYEGFVFELADRHIFDNILQYYEKSSNFVKEDNSFKGLSQKNDEITKTDEKKLVPINNIQKHPKDSSVYHYSFKIILVGSNKSGKKKIMNIFSEAPKHITTIGIDFFTLRISLDSGLISKITILDTAGQERYRTLTSSYFSKAKGIAFVYSITNRETFSMILGWLPTSFKSCEKDCKFILIGSNLEKCLDNPEKREVSTSEGEDLARINNMLFIEISSKDKQNCYAAFKLLSEEITKNEKIEQKKPELKKTEKKKRKWFIF